MRLVLAAALVFTAGCARVDGPLERYRLEQQLWRAQFFERRINISFMRASLQDTRMAIASFQLLLARDPLAEDRAKLWAPDVVEQIRDIQVVSRIALANLYFLSERYVDAGTLYRETLETAGLSLERSLELRLGAARSLYLVGENEEVMEQCAAIFRDLAGNPAFWSEDREISPAFMNVPAALARMYHESGDAARADEFSRLALVFYDRVAAERPRTDMAWQATLGGLQICLSRRDWKSAVARVNSILSDPTLEPGVSAEFELLLGEIHAFALRDAHQATAILQGLVSRYPGSGADFAARYDLAMMAAERGDDDAAMKMFREVEQNPSAPDAVASRAMFARARVLERRGDWDEAYTLYRRVEHLYPFTVSAIEAPLVITRHYVNSGELGVAQRALDRAREYYLSLLDRASPFTGDRLLVQAALTEAFVAAGRGEAVAELLGSGSARWDEAGTVAAMLRSAEVYEAVLGDRERAAQILKKCIERFPETRYSKVAQRRLDALEGGPE